MPKKETKTEEKVEKEEGETPQETQTENASEQVAPEAPISETATDTTKAPSPETQSPISMEPVGDITNTASTPPTPPTTPTASPSETLPIDQAGAERPMQETYPLADEIEKDAVKKRSFFSSLLIFRDKKGKIILMGIIFAVLIALVAATVLNTKNEKLSFISGKNKTRETVSLTPTEAPTATPTAAAAIDKGQLSIEVQNGSGESGVAGKMKNLLVEKGYTGTISTGNADNYDYTETVIKIKKTKTGIESELRSDISKDYTLAEEGEVLDDESEYDIVIIVGAEEITP